MHNSPLLLKVKAPRTILAYAYSVTIRPVFTAAGEMACYFNSQDRYTLLVMPLHWTFRLYVAPSTGWFVFGKS